MEFRKLGRSGLRVSEVALGGWLTQGRTLDDSTTSQLVHHAFDQGVNFFDTADVYNRGEAEISLGKAIRDLRREDLVIATKCFFPMSDGVNDRGLSRKHIFESVHASLKRLGTDYVDLMQCHRYDPETPVEETVRAMDDLARQGKIHYWGVSQWKAHEIMDAWHLAGAMGAMCPVSNQPVYNMLTRGIESSVIPTCEQLGLSQVVFSPLAQGVLTGKYRPGQPPPAGSRAADPSSNQFMQDDMTDDVLDRVHQVGLIAEQVGMTLPQFALAWCLRQPNLASVIVGATSVAQLDANLAAAGVKQPAEVWERAEQVLSST